MPEAAKRSSVWGRSSKQRKRSKERTQERSHRSGESSSKRSSTTRLAAPSRENLDHSAPYSALSHYPAAAASASVRSFRPSASRYSLNEHFAATRREIEFDFDDGASSVFDRMTIASESVGVGNEEMEGIEEVEEEEDDENDLVGEEDDAAGEMPIHIEPTFYELLCVSQTDSLDAIRSQYYRLFLLLHPDVVSDKVRDAAEAYFSVVQVAFETLVDPARRLRYDLNLIGHTRDLLQHGDALQLVPSGLHPLSLGPLANQNKLEMGFRFDANKISRHGLLRGTPVPNVLDFGMSQAFLLSLPRLGNALDKVMRVSETESPNAGLDKTGLLIQASTYGILQDILAMPKNMLADPFQSTTCFGARSSAKSLNRALPAIKLKFHHKFQVSRSHGKETAQTSFRDRSDALVEIETDVLPNPTLALRLARRVTTPWDGKPMLIQIGMKKGLTPGPEPQVGMILQRQALGGFLQGRVESGDWSADALSEILRGFFSPTAADSSINLPPLLEQPKLEFSYRVGSLGRPAAACSSTWASDRGLDVLDWEDELTFRNRGSWTVSTTAGPGDLGASMKYSIDLGIFYPRIRQLLSRVSVPTPASMQVPRRDARLEVELASTSQCAQLLAVRCLKRIGRLSKLGLEVSLSTYTWQLAMYWSRPSQRIRIPFLLLPTSSAQGNNLGTTAVFWSAVMPFTGLAMWQAFGSYVQRRLLGWQPAKQKRQNAKIRSLKKELDELRREEAEMVTALVAPQVERRQRSAKSQGGLVILGASYESHLKQGTDGNDDTHVYHESHGEHDFADVTTAVAALVDSGDGSNAQLYIPRGLRKSHLLGFWSPSAGDSRRDTVLRVRYSVRGEEKLAEVWGDEELLLP